MELCSSATSAAALSLRSKPTPTTTSTINPYPILLPLQRRPITNYARQFSLIQHHPSPKLSTSARPTAVASSLSTVEDVLETLPADIIVTETPQPNSSLVLHVEVPTVVCNDCYKRVLREFRNMKVPGFRTGKVPESVLAGYIGKERVQKATIESILKRTIPHAMSSVSDRALSDSIQIATKFSDLEKTYSPSKPLRYDIIVDVEPEVKWLVEDGYKNLKVVVEIDSDIDAQKASEQELKRRYKGLSTMRIVTDRGLQVGDVTVLDISATKFAQDGSSVEKVAAAESKGFNFDTEEAETVLPGFLESIIGIQRGETKSFPLVFPESWRQEELRGLNAQFTVECKELFYRELPELNDSIADKLVPGCTTLEQVKELILQRCREVEQAAREQATDNVILDQIRKMVDVDVPQSLFEEQGRQLYGAKLLEIQANVKLNEQQLESLSSAKAVQQFLDTQKENIEETIKQNMAVADIFKRENFQLATDEIVKEVENSVAEFKRHQQEYDEGRVKERVEEVLMGAKVLEWLREQAEIQYITK